MTDYRTPPDSLIEVWWLRAIKNHKDLYLRVQALAADAAYWGQDQVQKKCQEAADLEFETCCNLLEDNGFRVARTLLRSLRRPDPKHQALAALDKIISQVKDTHARGCLESEINHLREVLSNV